MRAFKLDELITPMVWGYIPDVLRPGYFPDGLFEHLGATFNDLSFASAFKGANGISTTFMEIRRYVANTQSYYNLYQKFHEYLAGKVSLMVLTGWQRYNHDAPLCELLPSGIPTLVSQVFYTRGWFKEPAINETAVEEFMGCKPAKLSDIPFRARWPRWRFLECSFPGVELYRLIERDLRLAMWKLAITKDTTEIRQLRPQLEAELSKIYSLRTVNEWLAQNVDAVIRSAN
ncbi:Beta-N-acetylhexosaminidase [Aphelenchoides fujianensis]|nr:Beta-N-acetylhexosaminidase [Aphelenchoides fujianensis]